MATLNKNKAAVTLEKISAEETINFEGAVAYNYPDKTRLINRVLGAFWNEDLFYVGGKPLADDTIADIKKVASVDPKFPLQLAAYARNELYLRTTPQVILVVCANIPACKPFIREYAPKIIKRADELAAVTAFQLTQYGKPIPNSLKKGLSDAFATFDEYQLNKYDSDKKSVSLGDVLRLIYRKKDYPVSQAMANYLEKDEVDPEALPKIYALKRLLAKDSLDEEALALAKTSSVTWETFISKFGSSKETWEIVIPNMGYMALLRNLRNFIDKDVDLAPVLEKIQNPEQVKKSKQLPFRFYSAFNNVRDNQKVKRAIAQAFEHSLSNVTLDGTTAIFVDHSASMDSRLSQKSDASYFEVGAVLGAIATKKAAESVMVTFGETAQIVPLNPDDTMITNIEKIKKAYVGHSTNAWLAFDELISKNIKVDRVILISDMQCYNDRQNSYAFYSGKYESVKGKWEAYRKISPNARLYSLDVSAYGTSQLPSTDGSVTQISGWSDKILDYINLSEKADVMEKQITKW
jgi:hypothetical protein